MTRIILQNKISQTVASLIDRSIKSINIPYGITKIGNCVFSLCYRLSSVTIPDSVTSVGE